MDLPEGYLLQNGKYKITHVVGQGGFGITYKGVWYTEVKGSLGTIQTEIPICVKEYFFKDYCYRDPDSQEVMIYSETGKALFDKFKGKLIKEAKILSEVHHPHIVNVLEVFEENNTAYIAMEYIHGFSLKYVLEKKGVLPESTVLRYVRQIGEALQFVHEKNILHLDIKPSNILVDKNGNAHLIDFGVSKRYDFEKEETSTTMLTLSKGFASIEQYDNEGTQVFSPRPDIYSLGATMYNLLTGEIPVESILRATHPLKRPSEINPSLTAQTEEVILKAMQVVPENRYGSVAEMMDALDFSQMDAGQAQCLLDLWPEDGKADAAVENQLSESEGAEEEETIVNVPPDLSTPLVTVEKKKTKKKVISIGIAIFAIVGSVAAFLILNQRSPKMVVEQVALPQEKDLVPEEAVIDTVDLEETEIPDAPVVTVDPVPMETKEAEKALPAKEEVIPVFPSEERVDIRDIRYDSLLASGRDKMAKTDYAGAKVDLSMAKDTKLTEEVVRLIIACDEKAEEKRMADKIAQYEQKMPFGEYIIVRKKSNSRYGAIDTEGEERIPCKYLNVGLSENGRAFEREDGLYDIYDTNGMLIGDGRTFY